MTKYILKRIVMSIFVIFLIATATFWLCRAIPGGPFDKEKPLNATTIANLNKKFHLDKPVSEQYVDYMVGVAKFDFGPSYYHINESVNDYIDRCFPVSMTLGVWAMIVATLLGIPAGIVSALKQNGWQDNILKVLTTLFVSLPNFVIASGLMYFLGIKLRLLPVSMWGTWKEMVMPVLALAAYPLSYFTKMMKSSMLEVLNSDYIRTAKAKGASNFIVIYKHALKNALLPIITVMGPMFASIITGSFVVEKLFVIPGLGQEFTKSIFNRDYTMIMGLTIFYSILLIASILIVDVLYAVVDPRIKLGKEGK
ncbi:MAG: ABC transporter permease [Erysipelotrichaceae bacterium]|nr:ABC transporter permease [Erysipelotrichaceae bacterium]